MATWKDMLQGLNGQRVVSLIVVVLAVIAGAAIWLSWPSTPVLAISTRRLDLGDGEPEEEMRGTFQIRNDGSEPLQYQIQSSCGCTRLKSRNGTVDPGGMAWQQEIDNRDDLKGVSRIVDPWHST